ncbi:hypothetical protein BC829DRAFT_446046 [Chytridium lagenaria]|nr:hypothetical protein BC829DRAFT_446046 [Chytridium lagenaria]
MPVFKDKADCKYARSLECGKVHISGFDTYAQILTMLAWLSVTLGFISIYLSVRLRRERAIFKNLPTVPGYHQLNPFELFLFFYTLSCTSGSIALTLSAFANTLSIVFYTLMSARNFLVFTAIYLYVDLMLSINSNNDAHLLAMRRIYLKLLFIPKAIVFGMFIFQGYLSDLTYSGGPEYGPGTKIAKVFDLVIVANQIALLMIFLILNVLVIIARIRFSRYLKENVELELMKERATFDKMADMTSKKNKEAYKVSSSLIASGPLGSEDQSLAKLDRVNSLRKNLVKAATTFAKRKNGTMSNPGIDPQRISYDAVATNVRQTGSQHPLEGPFQLGDVQDSPRGPSEAPGHVTSAEHTPGATGSTAIGLTSRGTSGFAIKPVERAISHGFLRHPDPKSHLTFRSPTMEMARQLRSSIVTMKWLILALTVFLLYSIFFAAVILYIGTPNPVYFLTLAVNWWWPVEFGTVIFGIVIVQRARQFRDLWAEMEEGGEWMARLVSPIGSHHGGER